MAYPTICDPCLDERHDECLGNINTPPPPLIGGGFCVCGHGAVENAFQQSVRARVTIDRLSGSTKENHADRE